MKTLSETEVIAGEIIEKHPDIKAKIVALMDEIRAREDALRYAEKGVWPRMYCGNS